MAEQSTKTIVNVADIRDGIIVLENGSLRSVLEVSAVNFELRSPDEQAAILQGFQGILNSVDFPIEIVINSRKLSLDAYIKEVETMVGEQQNELLRIQASEYAKFVQELSTLSNIMTKKFYIVIPLYVLELSGSQGVLSNIKNVFRSAKTEAPKFDDQQFATYKNQLAQRAELLISGLVSIGVRGRILTQDELRSLLAEWYNPKERVELQKNV
ncbi:MAG: hypothetical protein QY311_02110 [Candidatus Paceibacterota bacterium]|nr:MAG: hypothetical protein QY311_02110 [Candidatus Paceibacterota bacterium]